MKSNQAPRSRAVKTRTIAALAAAATALVPISYALAQTSTPAAAPLSLDKIIVTGTARHVSKMKSSVSVSTLGAETIATSGAKSAADILRSIPGIRSEASGGESNGNLTVRGLPISAGGARYVQYQIDGLPVLDFGDIAFATPDSFLRVDGLLSEVQVIRGGSSSTAATNAPGGIINFISKTGLQPGGSLAVTTGLGYDEKRIDFDYGGPIDSDDRYEIAGFYHNGTGDRTTSATVINGGQIHGNITHDIQGGYIRLNFGYLDDITPTDLPVPVQTVGGKIEEIPGVNPLTASFYSKFFGNDITLTQGNTYRTVPIDTGNEAVSKSIGGEFYKSFDNGATVDDNFRYAANSGAFVGLYPADNGIALTGATYATGPDIGQPFTGKAFGLITFDTHVNNVSNIANDLKISAPPIETAGFGTFIPTGGLYTAQQKVDLTWDFNEYYATLTGKNSQFLNGTGGDGTTGANLQVKGIGAGFGYCCERVIDGTYLTTSPYFDLGWNIGNFTSDGSVREDIQQATGSYNFGAAGPNGNAVYNEAGSAPIKYTVEHTDYSVGTNYEFNHDLATFVRVSDGVSFNADRAISGPGAQQLNGTVPIPINEVEQYEGGIKYRMGNLNTFLSIFDAQTQEHNYDVTTQVTSANKYGAYGAELEFGYALGNFRVTGGATYTHARINSSNETKYNGASVVGDTPQRQADWVYQIMPSYTWNNLTVGGSAIGTTSSYGDDQNDIVMPGYVLINAFATYDITPRLSALLTANNLFNQIAYTELDGISNGAQGDATAARSFDGRTVTATLRLKFD